jgi:hypothetical protein
VKLVLTCAGRNLGPGVREAIHRWHSPWRSDLGNLRRSVQIRGEDGVAVVLVAMSPVSTKRPLEASRAEGQSAATFVGPGARRIVAGFAFTVALKRKESSTIEMKSYRRTFSVRLRSHDHMPAAIRIDGPRSAAD